MKFFASGTSSIRLLIALLFTAAGPGYAQPDTVRSTTRDLHTQSNADSVKARHLHLDVAVDFSRKAISGAATWTLENNTGARYFTIDTDELRIDSVLVGSRKVPHLLGPDVAHLGSALSIPIRSGKNTVKIYYATGPTPRALQWLTPEQTDARRQPFLYTQSESIYARSWIPCPDGPGIRFTYSATVKVPRGLTALMSADRKTSDKVRGVYTFRMDIPIPAYLMALAVGELEFKAIDKRTGVWAEPTVISRANSEFRDVGKMVSTAEGLYGPYRWGRYDVLVLPPGFPIGGMENPKLTFATPTILAGDRSLVNLIAHELAHNWSGNLVTNKTWNDFWLNEGFTVYFERRLTEAMQGASYTDMLWELGYQDLLIAVDEIGLTSPDTRLKLNLTGRDPDDGLTDVAYEKGALLLKTIEQQVGRARFDPFLKKYFSDYAFSTLSTEDFLLYLDRQLIKGDKALAGKLRVNEWVYRPGIPDNAPRKAPARFAAVDGARAAFLSGTAPAALSTLKWSTWEWLHFLRGMPKPLSLLQMQALDAAFALTRTGNSEIADVWYVMAVASRYEAAYGAIDAFLSRVGRRKFLTPIYGEMMKTGQENLARSLFQKHKAAYHPLAQETLQELLYGN